MEEQEKHDILEKAGNFFRDRIAKNHLKNTKKLTALKKFNINPFTWHYLAKFAFGDTSPESLAKALVYPRVLGTSISTTFGGAVQQFCNDVLGSYASTTQGMDIEFIDALDGDKKYCQLKAGPQTINKDDIKTIEDHFKTAINLGRTNGIKIATADCNLGVLYGSPERLSKFYKTINEDYPVYVGKEFWTHLTGDETFYDDLTGVFVSVADELDTDDTLRQVIAELTEDIRKNKEI